MTNRIMRALLVSLLVAPMSSAQSDPSALAFLAWARQATQPIQSVAQDAPHEDLRPLARTLGRASIVALSEADHGIAEPLEFRNRLFRYLVEELGFTAIAIESGITESHVVHDYVRGGPGDLRSTMAQGISWTFDRLPQNRALIEWMRQYNADARHQRKINFYGFDVPGSPGNANANRGMRTALDDALRYLATVDSPAAAALQAKVDPWLPSIRFDRSAAPGPRYTDLTAAERDALTAAIADLVTLFEHRQQRYISASSSDAYQWAYRSVLGARAADAWLRKMPLGSLSPSDWPRVFDEALEVRDRSQADNLRWIVDQEGSDGKVLVFAAWVHIATTPIGGLPSGSDTVAVAGTYLRRMFGDKLVTIGNLFRRGEWYCGPDRLVRPDPTPGTLSDMLGALDQPLFVLDLRGAPPAATQWIDREHILGPGFFLPRLNPRLAFDLLFYIDRVSPACPS